MYGRSAVFYEMLTGRRAFGGQTPSDAIAAVLRDHWGQLPADTPRALVRLIKRCLRQDAHERLQDIGDARIEITELARQGTAVDRGSLFDSATPSGRPHRSLARRLELVRRARRIVPITGR